MNHLSRSFARRLFIQSAAAIAAAPRVWAQAPTRLPKLLLAGPFAAVANPLVRMVEAGLLHELADSVEFVVWKDPDQLRALALDGKVDFIAMPSNVAANLYNRGVRLGLLNIGTWGALYIVSRDDTAKTLADFKGKEVVMPFRGDMPDIVFRTLAARQGIRVDDEIRLRYVASPLDAMQLLLTRRADHALLAEPAVSVGLRKSKSFPVGAIAPDLYRSVNLQQEWGRVWQRPPRIPQAGMVVMGKNLENTALLTRFREIYAEALAWCNADPDACGELVAARVDMLTPEGVADAVRFAQDQAAPARQAREELEFFFKQLLSLQPGLVGGKLPAAGFYL